MPDGSERLGGAIVAQATRVVAGVFERLRIAIVGAGTTGIELAADLRCASSRLEQYRRLIDPAQLDVTLIGIADRPLPRVASGSSDSARRLLAKEGVATRFGAKATKVEAGLLPLAGGETIAANVLVWASGVRGRRLVGGAAADTREGEPDARRSHATIDCRGRRRPR